MAKANIDENILELLYEIDEPARSVLIRYIENLIYLGSDLNEYCHRFLPNIMTINNIDIIDHKKSTNAIFVGEYKHTNETVDYKTQMPCLRALASYGVPVYLITGNMPKTKDDREAALKSGHKTYLIKNISNGKELFLSLGDLDKALTSGKFLEL